jgi:hypothetical protein
MSAEVSVDSARREEILAAERSRTYRLFCTGLFYPGGGCRRGDRRSCC